jgi:large subunit ribosomal protein L19
MSDELLRSVEAPVNENLPQIKPGDIVSVYLRIHEGTTERTQEFRGTVLRMRKGGNNANFTVRRVASNGIGVERTFLLNSPRLEKVVIHRRSHVHRETGTFEAEVHLRRNIDLDHRGAAYILAAPFSFRE